MEADIVPITTSPHRSLPEGASACLPSFLSSFLPFFARHSTLRRKEWEERTVSSSSGAYTSPSNISSLLHVILLLFLMDVAIVLSKTRVVELVDDLVHGFRKLLYDRFYALLHGCDDSAFVHDLNEYLQTVQSQYMFVRVRRPPQSNNFVVGYMKCDRAFSFRPRYDLLLRRLCQVDKALVFSVETEEARDRRYDCLGLTDSELEVFHTAFRTYSGRKSKRGYAVSPLQAAIKAKDDDSALLLLRAGVDPCQVSEKGSTALHWAAIKNSNPFLVEKLLLVGGITLVNQRNNCGETALHRAARYNRHAFIKRLLEHPGIDTNFESSKRGRTPLQTAMRWDSTEAIALLEPVTTWNRSLAPLFQDDDEDEEEKEDHV